MLTLTDIKSVSSMTHNGFQWGKRGVGFVEDLKPKSLSLLKIFNSITLNKSQNQG